jgi:hypothetical protein
MANEGIMALPQGMGMQAEGAQKQPLTVTSADSYDASLAALQMTDPQEFEAFKQQLRQGLQGVEIPPEQLDTLIEILERLTNTPQDYPEFAQLARADGMDVPEEFDPEFVGALLVVLNEMRGMVAETMQDVTGIGPTVAGMEPAQFAKGGLADVAAYLQSQGRGGDRILAHITPGEAAMLQRQGGAGTINPVTGLPEYGWLQDRWNALKGGVKEAFSGIVAGVKKVLKSPVGKVLATIGLTMILGPTAIGAYLGSAGTAALASGAVTLAGGGNIKEALISSAMSYIGGGGTVMGVNPLTSVGSYLPGAAGGALNTGLATGVIGAGIGKLSGMSTADALKFGLQSGASAGAMKGLENYRADVRVKNEVFNRAGVGDETARALIRDGADAGTMREYLASSAAPTTPPAGPVGPTGSVGTAQDLLAAGENPAGGLQMPKSLKIVPPSIMDSAGNFAPDYSLAGAGPATPSPMAMQGAVGAGLQAGSTAMSGMPGMGGAPGSGLTAPMSSTATATGTPNYTLSNVQAPPAPQGFLDKAVTGAKNIYNEYLSPDRPGLPADAGLIRKYAPLALAGTGVMAAAGGMEGSPSNPNPAFNRNYTGLDYMRDNPNMFKGGLDFSYQRPTTPQSPVVETDFSRTMPIGPAGTMMPTGMTNSPIGVAQPYNMAGLYGVPLVYPVNRAKGGAMEMTQFPRKNGPIDGPGTGTSDSIPAMLSDGEFVFTAKAVRNAGGGSRRKGAARMYKLMKKLEGGPVRG